MYDWQDLVTALQNHLNQEQIAARLGVSQAFVSYLANGRRKSVGHEIGEKIIGLCSEYDVKPRNKKPA